uniref:PPM-type phosphatase domain-containing protein n=1 Tax=Auxenochlorella protothecoides TaxID=3075 RepID=A0A1D2AG61_AUXPR
MPAPQRRASREDCHQLWLSGVVRRARAAPACPAAALPRSGAASGPMLAQLPLQPSLTPLNTEKDVACAQCPLPDPGRLGEASVSLFCVFDGHCGRGAAEAAAVALPEEIGVRLPACEADMLEQRGAVSALRPAFLATDARIRAEEGCTATAVLAWSPRKGIVCLQAGNVGDSTALWIDPRTVEVVELTEDHRLSNERERRRLADMGIQLSKNSRRLYGLNLSRGLGDKFLKDEDLGLSAEPYVGPVVTCSASEGGLLLIASDGLWDVADFATVARVLCQSLRASGGDLVDGARAVLAHALKHRTKDDVSIVLARVLPEAEWEARSPPRSFSSGPIFGDP